LYFSGFCLKNEEILFNKYIIKNDFSLSGFSYGAILALKECIKLVKNNQRIDLLQLFSPSFFSNKNEKYKRLQLMYFKKNQEEYKNNFIKNITYPSDINLSNKLSDGTYEQLEELLNFDWKKEDFEFLIKEGVKIEIYLGAEDKIIDSYEAKDFFRNFAEIYFIKSSGHILQ